MRVLVKNDTLDPAAGGLINNVMYYYIKGYNFLTINQPWDVDSLRETGY